MEIKEVEFLLKELKEEQDKRLDNLEFRIMQLENKTKELNSRTVGLIKFGGI